MSKEDVMDYVMTTPSNPNRAVLSGMLDEISGTQLPSPTESDNGKVLGVSNGEYALVEQSGGSVEAIALGGAEVSFAQGEDYATGTQSFNKTLQDIIGDKTIIGIGVRSNKAIVPIVGYAIQVNNTYWLPQDQNALRNMNITSITYCVKRGNLGSAQTVNVSFMLYCI